MHDTAPRVAKKTGGTHCDWLNLQPVVSESHAGLHSPSKRAYIASQTHTTEHTTVEKQLVFQFAIILIEPCRYHLFPEKCTPFLSPALTYPLSHSVPSINILQDLDAEGDCHAGITVQHLSRIKANPNQLNLCQVHLIVPELLDGVSYSGEGWEEVKPGNLGENITTSGIAILELGKGTKLHFLQSEEDREKSKEGNGHPVVKVTGLRNPCHQINKFGRSRGLREKCAEKDPEMKRVTKRKAGVMRVMVRGGRVESGMRIFIEEPSDGKIPLEVV